MNTFSMEKINEDWTKPVDGEIDIPSQLIPLFNKVGTQIRFMNLSGKNEVLTIADIVEISRQFFRDNKELLS